MSNSLWPHGLQHTRPPCPSPTPRACSNSCPLTWWCHPTISSSIVPFSSCPQSFPASVFSNESVLHIRWPKYWSFSFSISSSNEYSGLISFWMDWLDLLEVQGTLKSLLQHHSSKASILQHSAFFIVQLSQPYMTTGKTIVLTKWTFVGKVMSLLFNMLSRLVITFLPRSKCLLITWLQSPSAVILEPKNIKSGTLSTFSPSICHEVMGPDAMILLFWMLSFKPFFFFLLFSFTFIKRLFNSSSKNKQGSLSMTGSHEEGGKSGRKGRKRSEPFHARQMVGQRCFSQGLWSPRLLVWVEFHGEERKTSRHCKHSTIELFKNRICSTEGNKLKKKILLDFQNSFTNSPNSWTPESQVGFQYPLKIQSLASLEIMISDWVMRSFVQSILAKYYLPWTSFCDLCWADKDAWDISHL